MDEQEVAVFYAVRNSDGQYFRAKGYGGGGASWVDTIEKAKIYPKIGTARSRVTWFANNHPSYPTPVIVKLVVTRTEVIDEKERVAKAKENKKKRMHQREVRQKQFALESAQRDLERAQERLDRIKQCQE